MIETVIAIIDKPIMSLYNNIHKYDNTKYFLLVDDEKDILEPYLEY
jgi:hypothetical protein